MSVKYNRAPSSLKFYIPPTLASDFDNFLSHDIPNQVMDFKVYHNWYDNNFHIERAELYPDSTKSRYENTDSNMNIRFSVSADVDKGDIVIDENGRLYILDWGINPEHNNKASRAVECNFNIELKRFEHEKTDEYGIIEEPEGWKTVVPSIPCNGYRYDGRPEFSAVAANPGVIANSLSLFTVQCNSTTKDIRIGDQFTWGTVDYEVVDVNYNGVNFFENDSRGTLKLSAKKVAGEDNT